MEKAFSLVKSMYEIFGTRQISDQAAADFVRCARGRCSEASVERALLLVIANCDRVATPKEIMDLAWQQETAAPAPKEAVAA